MKRIIVCAILVLSLAGASGAQAANFSIAVAEEKPNGFCVVLASGGSLVTLKGVAKSNLEALGADQNHIGYELSKEVEGAGILNLFTPEGCRIRRNCAHLLVEGVLSGKMINFPEAPTPGESRENYISQAEFEACLSQIFGFRGTGLREHFFSNDLKQAAEATLEKPNLVLLPAGIGRPYYSTKLEWEWRATGPNGQTVLLVASGFFRTRHPYVEMQNGGSLTDIPEGTRTARN